jgi:predicted glycogen debranching enzyme
VKIDSHKTDNPEFFFLQEWLVTNGLGGFACGSIGGTPHRKYHGLLIAALKAPLGRSVMLNFVADSILLPDGRKFSLSNLHLNNGENNNDSHLVEFKLDNKIPEWHYQIGNIHLEKSIWMAHGQNTVYIHYHLLSSNEPIQIEWRPYLHFRNSEQSVNANAKSEYEVHTYNKGYEITSANFPSLKLYNDQLSSFTIDSKKNQEVLYEIEKRRGYEFIGSLISPGYFLITLTPHQKTTFIASSEPWEIVLAMTTEEALIAEKQRLKGLLKVAKPLSFSKTASKLILAADQFIMTPISRETDVVRLKAMGEDVRSVIAGYPWFTDWGRDTMISLEGLTLVTGRFNIANAILHTFAYYIRDGLIPNMFPDGESEGLYHTVDATLWFFHAVDRYLEYTHDDDFLEFILPKFQQIIDHHIKGTRFGIKMDKDGLLTQGQEGYQLTWMDAKVGDWVVTPRRGKAVEINALWYNVLKLMEKWTGKHSDIAEQCFESFNTKFWFEEGLYLYDVIEGEHDKDPAIRPNQIFSISLKFPILKQVYWQPVVDIVHKQLLTSYGLRTLASSHPDFKAYYDGDILTRDASYHQGTVWPWLIGHFIDAWLKVYPEKENEARQFLEALEKHIDEGCLGSVAEIFDSSDPFHVRGCFAQAWSVAELLRAYSLLHTEFKSH